MSLNSNFIGSTILIGGLQREIVGISDDGLQYICQDEDGNQELHPPEDLAIFLASGHIFREWGFTADHYPPHRQTIILDSKETDTEMRVIPIDAEPLLNMLGAKDIGEAMEVVHFLKLRASLGWQELKALKVAEGFGLIHGQKGLRTPGYTEPEIIGRLVSLGLAVQDQERDYRFHITQLGIQVLRGGK